MRHINQGFQFGNPWGIVAAFPLALCCRLMVQHGGGFMPCPVIPETRHRGKFGAVVEYRHIGVTLGLEIHQNTFATSQLSTSCGTGIGADCRDRKRRSGRFLIKVSGTRVPSTVSHFSVFWSSLLIAP